MGWEGKGKGEGEYEDWKESRRYASISVTKGSGKFLAKQGPAHNAGMAVPRHRGSSCRHVMYCAKLPKLVGSSPADPPHFLKCGEELKVVSLFLCALNSAEVSV
ncbi:hypothetical protein E2C01_063017 [Portunus trituberculatus]|uniref:Uncharacterized protein n=1 Tax=Portunus trituberculatus TaxID=210409 RepID=A0A5B7HHM6_PORTR|nr:hypothetical protein [Portunus trituberculatus]